MSTGPLPVERGWSVDATGTIQTLPEARADGTTGAQRVIVVSPENVWVYCDAAGRPGFFPPPEASDAISVTKRSLAELSGGTVSAMSGGGLPPLPDGPDPPDPVPGSRDSLKYLPDGAQVSTNGAIVSATFDFDGAENDFCYVERSDRSFGIWVNAPAGAYYGDLVDVSGTMATGGGERAILADSVEILDFFYPRPPEIGMPNKALGGGAVGSYTPAVADGAGLNNTGLLVKVWGKVTAKDAYGTVYYLDDGSAVESDDGNAGVKVYDLYELYPPPDVGDYRVASGVSSAEIPDGAATSIRTVWVPDMLFPPDTGPGQGTVSGTVTAVGADGLTVTVYSTSASTTATFAGDTASYANLTLPEGDNAVTATVIGYKTTTQRVTVTDGGNTVADFTLTGIPRVIDVVASPSRIPPDGVSEMTITAIVRDGFRRQCKLLECRHIN